MNRQIKHESRTQIEVRKYRDVERYDENDVLSRSDLYAVNERAETTRDETYQQPRIDRSRHNLRPLFCHIHASPMVSCSTRPARAGSPVSVELRVLTLTEALSSVLSLQAKFSLSLWRNTRFLMHMCTVARDKGSWLSSKERLNVRSGTKAAQEKQLVPTPPSFYGRSIAKPWKSSARRNCLGETTPSTTGKNESWRRRRERG